MTSESAWANALYKVCEERDALKAELEVAMSQALVSAGQAQDAYAALLASLWQPIETAPKDGTEVLCFRGGAGVFLAAYGAMDVLDVTDRVAESVSEDVFCTPDWWAYTNAGPFRCDGVETPTHWMPLPKPPNNDQYYIRRDR